MNVSEFRTNDTFKAYEPGQLQINASSKVYKLTECVDRALIIAYKESTEQLESTLRNEGFQCQVVRQQDKSEYQGFASIYRCMLNHRQAWEQAAQASRPTLIVEADFVPVIGMGRLPLPFDLHQANVGISWLYTCAPQVYSVLPAGYAEGFSTGLVAYILTPKGAASLCGLVDTITQKWGTGYVNFDSEVDEFLRLKGFKNYIPFRNYGEHGGCPNPEHRSNGMSGIHRADVLYGNLAFQPAYALATSHPQLELFKARFYARLKGIGRLVTGRFLRKEIVQASSVPGRLIRFALHRQLTIRL